jgi:hypothetical protein
MLDRPAAAVIVENFAMGGIGLCGYASRTDILLTHKKIPDQQLLIGFRR